ncbi:MAG: galactokinase [Verrucomicrobiota bacterium]
MIKALFKKQYGSEPTVCAQAPGRLEFIGNHTDYNGGPVLGVAVNRHVSVALAPRNDELIRIWSGTIHRGVEIRLSELAPLTDDDGWANYALGVLDELIKAGMTISSGFDMAVDSDLPAGSGMSSSAAFELSSACALCELYGFEIDRQAIARLARRAENNFVGVPCGILDQGVCTFGKEHHLVSIDCQTETFGHIRMPEGVNFWVFNTAKKHALVDSLYSTRHRECMDALADLQTRFKDLKCLAEISLEDLEDNRILLSGALYHRAHHVVSECARVHAVKAALEDKDMEKVGRLIFASHASSRDDFENSIAELDFLVDKLHNESSVWGARLTGGGFGGAVMAVTTDEFDQAAAESIAGEYLERFGQPASVFHTLTGNGAQVI